MAKRAKETEAKRRGKKKKNERKEREREDRVKSRAQEILRNWKAKYDGKLLLLTLPIAKQSKHGTHRKGFDLSLSLTDF
ncbi:hypothetical protein CEXT_760701 [Caerostris extrusa]|uniref:Uncharacterized protein n=1 Tax=Caerostris extrusa TaxID=172846 RepID=A0AAV4S8K1_CAEEX|nr:hypothetical protein CEXT_760701 [Caerostris extrusa]